MEATRSAAEESLMRALHPMPGDARLPRIQGAERAVLLPCTTADGIEILPWGRFNQSWWCDELIRGAGDVTGNPV